MAASNPFEQNDYQAVDNLRPYRMPVNDAFNALVKQNEFWELGAQRVKSVYDNALNLKLSLEPNKEIRKKFIQDSEKQLTKLSRMDLSNGSIQRQGQAIFKPLFDDEGIIYDDAMTRHYEQVREDALSYRERDGGKGYADTNLNYAMDGYKDFVNSKDRMAGKQFYQNRKEYTPFYDPSTEFASIMKNCKPDKATNAAVQGYYMHSYSNESLTSAKVNTCLDGQLSDRAKRQLQINGYVTYKNNPQALRDKYVPHLQGTISQLEEENSAIKGVLANKGNLKSLKKEDLQKLGLSSADEVTPDLIKRMEETVKLNDNRVLNMTTSVNKLLGNDFTDISGENLEPIAGAMYSRDYMQNVSEGFSYNFTNNTMKADPIQSMFYTQKMINARQEDSQAHDIFKLGKELDNQIYLKQLDMMGKGAAGGLKSLLTGRMGGIDGEALIDGARTMNDADSPFSSIDKQDSYDKITDVRKGLSQQRLEYDNYIIKELKNNGLDASITSTSDPRFKNFYENFKTTAKSDPEKMKLIDEYEQRMARNVSLDKLYSNTQDNVDVKLKPLEAQMEKQIASIAPVTIKVGGKNLTITSSEVLNALNGKGSRLQIIQGSAGTQGSSGPAGLVNVNSGYRPDTYIYDGKVIESTYGKSGYPLHELIRGIVVKHGENAATIKKQRNELMGRETVLQREGYAFPMLNSNDEKNDFKNRIAQNINLNLKFIDDLTIGQTDLDGRVIVTLNTDRVKATKEYDATEVLNKLKRYNGRDNKPVPGTDNSFVLEGISELDIIDENNLSSIMKPYIRSMEERATAIQNESTGFIPGLNGRSYRLDVGRSYGGGFSYKIYDSESSSPIYSTNNRNDALAKFELRTQTKETQISVPTTK